MGKRAGAALLPWLPAWAWHEGGQEQQGRKGTGTQQMPWPFSCTTP